MCNFHPSLTLRPQLKREPLGSRTLITAGATPVRIHNPSAARRYSLFFLFTLTANHCRPMSRAANVDPIPVYATALGGGLLRYRDHLALERHFMSDSGTYEASGVLPEPVVAFLLSHGIVAMLCAPLDSSNQVPTCHAESARGELRVSRPIAVGDTAVIIYVGQASHREQSDTPWVRHVAFATTHKCRVVRDGTMWKLRQCDLHMIT